MRLILYHCFEVSMHPLLERYQHNLNREQYELHVHMPLNTRRVISETSRSTQTLALHSRLKTDKRKHTRKPQNKQTAWLTCMQNTCTKYHPKLKYFPRNKRRNFCFQASLQHRLQDFYIIIRKNFHKLLPTQQRLLFRMRLKMTKQQKLLLGILGNAWPENFSPNFVYACLADF